ncbi:hypothetical protein BDR26DRAFT_412575 [Obelidium mucronatum]|nr:hypothetical protein BDR26DRAFT_412575 [Obelidium mucronatum]
MLSFVLLLLDTLNFYRAYRRYSRKNSSSTSLIPTSASFGSSKTRNILFASSTNSTINVLTTTTTSPSNQKGPPVDLMENEDIVLAAMLCVLIVTINVSAVVFMSIEGWNFRNAEQWYLASISTLGFGVVQVKTPLGRVLLMFFNTFGIILVGLILTMTSTKLIQLIRKFLLRGIRNMRRRAADRKRRVLHRRAVLAARQQEADRITREKQLAELQAFQNSEHDHVASNGGGSLYRFGSLGQRWASTATWHGNTNSGKVLADAGRAIGSAGRSNDTILENAEGGERASVISENAINNLAIADSKAAGAKELARTRSESALTSLFGINIKANIGSRPSPAVLLEASVDQNTATPGIPPVDSQPLTQNAPTTSTTGSDQEISHQTSQATPSFIPLPQRAATPSNSASANSAPFLHLHPHHLQPHYRNAYSSSSLPSSRTQSPLPYRKVTKSHQSQFPKPSIMAAQQQQHPSIPFPSLGSTAATAMRTSTPDLFRGASSVSPDPYFDLGLPLVRTDTVDSTTEAAAAC